MDPEDPIAVFDLGALDASLEDDDLLAKGDVLQSEARPISDETVDEDEELGDLEHWAS